MKNLLLTAILAISLAIVGISIVTICKADEFIVYNSALITQGKIKNIKDGDTFEIETQEGVRTCRLIGIDTPEKFKGKKLNADVNKTGIRSIVHMEAGAQATDYAKEYFSKRYSPDVQIIVFERDLYGRDLCLVGSVDRGDVSIQNSYNCDILLDGYAIYYKQGKNLRKTMREEFNECDIHDSGLWKTMPTLMEGLYK